MAVIVVGVVVAIVDVGVGVVGFGGGGSVTVVAVFVDVVDGCACGMGICCLVFGNKVDFNISTGSSTVETFTATVSNNSLVGLHFVLVSIVSTVVVCVDITSGTGVGGDLVTTLFNVDVSTEVQFTDSDGFGHSATTSSTAGVNSTQMLLVSVCSRQIALVTSTCACSLLLVNTTTPAVN